MIYTSILMSLTVPLIAYLRRQTWSANAMPFIVAGIALGAYVGGQYLDGTVPAFTLDYLRGFLLAVGGQQVLHRMIQNTSWFQAIEAAGNPRGAIAQPRVGDKQW